jgi:hypothetical protein
MGHVVLVGDDLDTIATDLMVNAFAVQRATPAILESPPIDATYLFVTDEALARCIMRWTEQLEPRPGTLGIVDSACRREALLAIGFDDAIAVPYSCREVAARIRAVHRRARPHRRVLGRLRLGPLMLDLDTQALWWGESEIVLTPIEHAVMRELMRAGGRPLSRDALRFNAWGDDELPVDSHAVDTVVLRLRRKLPDPELLETVRRVGFRLRA